MGHGKLKKFAENKTFRCLLQPDASAVLAAREPGDRSLRLCDHPIKGRWGGDMFGNDHPIVLELGCGKGDYTIALARRHPEINYIGVDIKGARLWKGAKEATETAMPNVAFLRTRIEFIEAFFGPGEVSEIWLTFSDPQLRGSENSRLSSPLFLERYRKFLAPGGIVHLKTDSRYLYEYTQAVCRVNGLSVLASGTDVYHEGLSFGPGLIVDGRPSPQDVPCTCVDGRISGPGTQYEIGPGPKTDSEEVTAVGPGPKTDSEEVTAVGPVPRIDSEEVTAVGPGPRIDSEEVTAVGPGPKTDSEEVTAVGPGPKTDSEEVTAVGPGPRIDSEEVTRVQTFYERMFLEMGLPITYMAFCIDHDGPYRFPGEAFDHDYWLEAEGPRRSFSHQPTKK